MLLAQWHDCDRGGRRVDPPRLLGRGNTLDPVHPHLKTKLLIDTLPFYLK